MKQRSILLSGIFVLILLASQAFALPRFALMRGEANCLGCHVNPTGGQLRGPGGVSYAINDLPMWKRGENIKYTGDISEGLRLGGDFRSQLLYFAQKGPLGQNKADTTLSVTSFHAMSLAFELDVKATNTLHGFFRYDPLGLTPSEGWAILHFVHSSGEIFKSTDAVTNAYVKVGSFLPAFGVRFDDHTVYVKGGTASLSGFAPAGFFWSPGYRDVGAEIGALFFDHIGITAGMFNGSETSPRATFSTDPNKALCVRINAAGEFIEDMLAGEIGFSRYMHNSIGGQAVNLALNAAHVGLRAGPVSILGEYDFGENVVLDNAAVVAKATALCLEGAVRITKGLDGILRYETFSDENPAGTTDTKVKGRIMIGAQWFPIRFLEIRPEFRIAHSSSATTQGSTALDDFTENTFLVQTHVFF